MMLIIAITCMFTIIPLFLYLCNLIFSKKMFTGREKASPYECGFDPLNAMAESFSVQFFLISIMFLTFDMEIVVLIPMIPSFYFKSTFWLISSSIVLIILIMGVYLEWAENSIKWQL